VPKQAAFVAKEIGPERVSRVIARLPLKEKIHCVPALITVPSPERTGKAPFCTNRHVNVSRLPERVPEPLPVQLKEGLEGANCLDR
jgi:hypothetical protein